MDYLCDLVCKLCLCIVDVPCRVVIRCNLVKAHECKELHELDDIGICYVSPVLVEVVWRVERRIKEHSPLLALSHLLAVCPHDEVERKSIALRTSHPLDEVYSSHYVAPLVCTSYLEHVAVVLVKHVVVVGLKELIVELYEGKSSFKSLLDPFEREHPVY